MSQLGLSTYPVNREEPVRVMEDADTRMHLRVAQKCQSLSVIISYTKLEREKDEELRARDQDKTRVQAMKGTDSE